MARDSIHSLKIETATLVRDVSRIYESASDVAEAVRDVGVGADHALADGLTDAPAEELHERAVRLKGAALHASALALELASHAGKLEQIAAVKRAAAPDDENEVA